MSTLVTVTKAEDFILQMNGDYNICFETISITVSGALAAGTVLKDAATAAVDADTASIGILAEAKAAGTQSCRIMVRGNPSLVDPAKLSVRSATIKTALQAKGLVFAA